MFTGIATLLLVLSGFYVVWSESWSLPYRVNLLVHPLLGFLVEDLDDLVGKHDVAAAVGHHGLLGRLDGQSEVEAAGPQQILLGEVVKGNSMSAVVRGGHAECSRGRCQDCPTL